MRLPFYNLKNRGSTACTHHHKATMEKFASKNERPVCVLGPEL
jgi:hypothetical protein